MYFYLSLKASCLTDMLTEFLLVSSQLNEVINLLQKSGPAIRLILQHCDVRVRATPGPHAHKYIHS